MTNDACLRDLTRRQVLVGAGSLAAGATANLGRLAMAETTAANVATLGALAAEKGLLFGASFSVEELDKPGGVEYAKMYQRETRVLTSELEFKMAILRPQAGQLDFAPADRLMAFAKANNQKVRGHTLIWNDYLPGWIKALSSSEVERLLETHLTSVMTRYSGQIFEWDIVNEPIGPWDRLAGKIRGGPFTSAMGEDYIGRSFRLAKQLDPAARLFLNEAQTETDDENGQVFRDSLLALVRRLLDKGTPLTGIGLQCHLSSKFRYDFEKFAAFAGEFAALGLEISITELDVDDQAFPSAIAIRDDRVADLYRRFLTAILPIKSVKLLTTWQLADETSWIWYGDVEKRPRARRRPRPLLFDRAYRPKPAYNAVADAFRAMPQR